MLSLILSVLCLLATLAAGWRSIDAVKSGQKLRATRLVGWALVPAGAYLAGVVTLVARIGAAISRWLVSLVFNPVTWAGVILLAVAAALLVGTSFLSARRSSDATVDA